MKKITIIITILILSAMLSISFAACKTVSLEQKPFDRSNVSIIIGKDEAKVGDIIWTIEDVEIIGSEITDDIGGGVLETRFGRFVKVVFSAENIGDEIKTIINLKIIDSKGREFPVCAEAYSYGLGGVDDACLLVDVFPETKEDFIATFDIPLDSVDLILEVSDLGTPPDEKAYIDLGI